ncbi:unnamed protein product [Cyprideis torosa]|uniref:Uncharacterized protein n=1 Tax=Cyprideis torosa TaxID=163714 RepID=A0A7R8ZNW0_9CRUS|nr:unnamed protein product [Cyprideis torosa]CAG0892480.1 unnamed protein product [Cyprideis torosa]
MPLPSWKRRVRRKVKSRLRGLQELQFAHVPRTLDVPGVPMIAVAEEEGDMMIHNEVPAEAMDMNFDEQNVAFEEETIPESNEELLRKWVLNTGVARKHVDSLLKVLYARGFTKVRSARGLMHTPRKADVSVLDNGSKLLYLGVEALYSYSAPTHFSAFVVVQSHRLTNLVPGPSLIDPAFEVSSFVRQEIKLMIKCLSFVLSTQRSTATIVPFLDNSAMTPKVYLRGTKGKGKITPATTTELNRHLAAVIQMTNEDEKTKRILVSCINIPQGPGLWHDSMDDGRLMGDKEHQDQQKMLLKQEKQHLPEEMSWKREPEENQKQRLLEKRPRETTITFCSYQRRNAADTFAVDSQSPTNRGEVAVIPSHLPQPTFLWVTAVVAISIGFES